MRLNDPTRILNPILYPQFLETGLQGYLTFLNTELLLSTRQSWPRSSFSALLFLPAGRNIIVFRARGALEIEKFCPLTLASHRILAPKVVIFSE